MIPLRVASTSPSQDDTGDLHTQDARYIQHKEGGAPKGPHYPYPNHPDQMGWVFCL